MSERTYPMIVLIIEDSAGLAELWRTFLQSLATVRVAHMWDTGLKMMAEPPIPDIVILDLGLPDSRPPDTLARIKHLKEINPDATVIAITGNPEENIQLLAENLGADFFAAKLQYGDSQGRLLTAMKEGLTRAISRSAPSYTRGLEMLELVTTHLSRTH